MQKFIKDSEVAEILGVSVHTIHMHRKLKIGVPHYKIAKSVRYLEADVYDYVAQCKVTNETKLEEATC